LNKEIKYLIEAMIFSIFLTIIAVVGLFCCYRLIYPMARSMLIKLRYKEQVSLRIYPLKGLYYYIKKSA
jgi:hypothetical protein